MRIGTICPYSSRRAVFDGRVRFVDGNFALAELFQDRGRRFGDDLFYFGHRKMPHVRRFCDLFSGIQGFCQIGRNPPCCPFAFSFKSARLLADFNDLLPGFCGKDRLFLQVQFGSDKGREIAASKLVVDDPELGVIAICEILFVCPKWNLVGVPIRRDRGSG